MVDGLSGNRVPSDAELLVQPGVSGDLGAEIAMLVRQSAHRQAENARALQQAEDRMQTTAENAEVQKMREKAAVDLAANLASSSTSLVCNGVNFSAQMNGLAKKFDALARKVDPRTDLPCVRAEKIEKIVQATTEFVKEGVKLHTDALHFGANQLEADGKAAGNAAKHRERLEQAASDDQAAARKLAESAVEFRKEWTETTNATLLAVSRRG